jgi:hypothetical protein
MDFLRKMFTYPDIIVTLIGLALLAAVLWYYLTGYDEVSIQQNQQISSDFDTAQVKTWGMGVLFFYLIGSVLFFLFVLNKIAVWSVAVKAGFVLVVILGNWLVWKNTRIASVMVNSVIDCGDFLRIYSDGGQREIPFANMLSLKKTGFFRRICVVQMTLKNGSVIYFTLQRGRYLKYLKDRLPSRGRRR